MIGRLALLLCLQAAPAFAQGPPAGLDAKAAQMIVEGCAAHARAKSQSHAVAVVDTGGQPIASLRMDGNAFGIMDFALAKARASAAWGFSTARMSEAASATPGFADAPHVVITSGGLPVFSADGRRRLGAVGVSGEAPPDDQRCAEAGVLAAGLKTAPGPS